ncbi:MAG TPA: hypothetical protein VHZ03_28030 [Trebonia sp.]|nr:hypothetical protein [Trebonia sp.]
MVKDGAALRAVPASLALFRVGTNGLPKFVRTCDLDVAPEMIWWAGVVGR